MKIHVKICGITRAGDAVIAESLGASAVGFVFYPKSPRYITPESAGRISVGLGPFVARVGVFVDEEPSIVMKTVHDAKLTAVQLHGAEDNDYIEKLHGISVIKAFRIDPAFDCQSVNGYKADAFLFDAYVKDGSYGGTGETFDWNKIEDCKKYGKIILAGGLNAANISDAVKTVSPWAVDVSSGVEKSPGIKDHGKLKEFFEALDFNC
ncbi:phosphoribosylanthranilate isomerase [Candidatus Latescibacterota bacterium]